MSELNQSLPLLPITTGVLFPGMTTTLALETDGRRARRDRRGTIGWRAAAPAHSGVSKGQYASGRSARHDRRRR